MCSMNIYGSIDKTEPQDDGTLKVWGYASSEVLDSAGEIITAEAMKAAIPDYMAFGAVREMHDAKKAAGTAIEIEVQEDGRTYFGAHVVDAEAVRKVQHGVYKGFSIGGKVLDRDELQKNTITGLKLTEISLVDRPANPEAKFTMFKVDGSEEEHDLKKYAGEEVFDAGIALRMLEDAYWLLGMEKSEVEDYPEQIAALQTAIKALKDFIVSEIQEENGADGAKAALEDPKDVKKTEEPEDGKTEPSGNLAKIEDLQKRNDALAKQVEALQKASETIMKACESAGAEDGTDVPEYIEKLARQVKELEEMPEPPKAVLKDVTKVEDNGGGAPEEVIVKNADGTVNDIASEIKKIHQTGGYIQ